MLAIAASVPAFAGAGGGAAAQALQPFTYTVTANGRVVEAKGLLASHTLAPVLGAAMARGRGFAADEYRPGRGGYGGVGEDQEDRQLRQPYARGTEDGKDEARGALRARAAHRRPLVLRTGDPVRAPTSGSVRRRVGRLYATATITTTAITDK